MNDIQRIDEIKVLPELDHLLHALHPEEMKALRESIEEEGVRDPIVLWEGQDVVIDGHNRLRVAKEAGLEEVPVTYRTFETIGAVKAWMYRCQIGRRNTPEQMRAIYIGRLFEVLKAEVGASRAVEQIAQEEGLSERQVYRDAKFAEVYRLANEHLQNQYSLGEITAKDLITSLTDVKTPPAPLSKEERAEVARRAFPATVRVVAERVVTGIQTLRLLVKDVRLVFENQGIDLVLHAPLIATLEKALGPEAEEAMDLMERTYESYFVEREKRILGSSVSYEAE